MTRQTDITTDHDPNQTRHRLMQMGLVWLAVYPSVTLLTYLTSEIEAPTYIRTLMTTALTVPAITYLVVPNAKALISRKDPPA